MRASRAAAKEGPRGPQSDPKEPPSVYQVADDAMDALDDKVRLAVLDDHATKIGMVVVSKTEAAKLQKVESPLITPVLCCPISQGLGLPRNSSQDFVYVVSVCGIEKLLRKRKANKPI